MGTQVLGLSVDSVPCLTAWADSLGGISFPLLSDFYPHGQVARLYGVLRSDGRTERALFVIDMQGIIRYVDVHDIDSQPDNDELFRALAELQPDSAVHISTIERLTSPAPNADVILYCTPWCPACNKARAYLKEHGIEYLEVDISRDRAAAQQVREWANGYETTPTLKIKGTVIVDFNQARLAEVLGVT
jgi:glutaredoxin